tara:strand:+ start:447 stop:677 length:231 start_codon:yes stop_codon:yes gene_type:complete
MTKRFIAQSGGGCQVKIFIAETGTLHKIINVGPGTISSPPICTEGQMFVGVTDSSGNSSTKYYSSPGFALKKVVSL